MTYEGIFNTSDINSKITNPQIKGFSNISIQKVLASDDQEFKRLLDFDELAYFTENDTPKDHEPPRYSLSELKDIFIKGEIFEINGKLFTNNETVLLGFYIFEKKGNEDELYIGGLDIHPTYRNLGLGSWVLEIAECVAKQTNGIKKLTLTVDPLNGRGLSAYLKFGFRIILFEKNHFGQNCDRFLMVKNLEATSDSPINSSIEIECGDTNGLLDVVTKGFVGISLIRGADNYKNRILFIQ